MDKMTPEYKVTRDKIRVVINESGLWATRQSNRRNSQAYSLPQRFGGSMTDLDSNLFTDLTWESDPQPVEIIIKRKKK